MFVRGEMTAAVAQATVWKDCFGSTTPCLGLMNAIILNKDRVTLAGECYTDGDLIKGH